MSKTKQLLPVDKAVMIKCRYCELAETCTRRERKESYEKDGLVTRCIVTPNRPGQKRKEKRKRQRKQK